MATSMGKTCVFCHYQRIKCDASVRGLPCSSCVREGRQANCVLPTGKRRAKSDRGRPVPQFVPSVPKRHQIRSSSPTISESDRDRVPVAHNINVSYINIALQVENGSKSKTCNFGNLMRDINFFDSLTDNPSLGIHQLDPVDEAYLNTKGVFNLAPRRCIAAILRSYFECVYPFAPISDRIAFLDDFNHGRYSLFLLYALLAAGAIHVQLSTLSECGFASRQEAVDSFRSKATLLYDFQCERDQTKLLQGIVILGGVGYGKPTDKDFRFWFYNAARILAQFILQPHGAKAGKKKEPWSPSKIHKRIWRCLYGREVLLSFAGSQRTRIISQYEGIVTKITDEDWDKNDRPVPKDSESVLMPFTDMHKLHYIWYCNLAVTGSRCLAAVATFQGKDPKHVIEPLDIWRTYAQHALKMNDHPSEEGIGWIYLQATSYQYQCTLLRLLRSRLESESQEQSVWTKQQLHSSMHKLDSIMSMVSTNGGLLKLPFSLNSICILILLALHIERAMDTSELDIMRSISRTSICQAMLILRQTSDVPVIQQLFPTFERILDQNNIRFDPDDNDLQDLASGLDSDLNTAGDDLIWPLDLDSVTWQGIPEILSSLGDFPVQQDSGERWI